MRCNLIWCIIYRSDVTVAACQRPAPVKRLSTTCHRRVQSSNKHCAGVQSRAKSTSSATSLTSLLDSLLTDRDASSLTTDDCVDVSSPCVAAPVLVNENFSLFSEHLLSDSHGVLDVGLQLTDHHPAWTPSRLDDKVIDACVLAVLAKQILFCWRLFVYLCVCPHKRSRTTGQKLM